jgi:alkyl hydroperoxide reductase subunit AhpC
LAFDKAYKEFQKINCELLGVSCDSKFSHLAWTKLDPKQGGIGNISIPLLSDFDKTMAKDYGVLVPEGDENSGVTFRGSFLIDPNQNVRHMTVNDLPVGRNVEESLRLVGAFQFVDENGEVCPSNWKKKGDLTIKPDPKKSLEYFKKVNK